MREQGEDGVGSDQEPSFFQHDDGIRRVGDAAGGPQGPSFGGIERDEPRRREAQARAEPIHAGLADAAVGVVEDGRDVLRRRLHPTAIRTMIWAATMRRIMDKGYTVA